MTTTSTNSGRFQKGNKGNPKGRPKGSLNKNRSLDALLVELVAELQKRANKGDNAACDLLLKHSVTIQATESKRCRWGVGALLDTIYMLYEEHYGVYLTAEFLEKIIEDARDYRKK